MPRRIAVIQGHPSLHNQHFGHALAGAYVRGATDAGHQVRVVEVGSLDFPLLRTKAEWEETAPLPAIQHAQGTISWAEHLVIIYPLWLGTMPAMLKGFLEQVFRPGFAVQRRGSRWTKLLAGRSARIVVTMGMPALVYRWYFGAHSLKSLERNILKFSGVGPIRESLIGMVDARSDASRQKWLDRMQALGQRAR